MEKLQNLALWSMVQICEEAAMLPLDGRGQGLDGRALTAKPPPPIKNPFLGGNVWPYIFIGHLPVVSFMGLLFCLLIFFAFRSTAANLRCNKTISFVQHTIQPLEEPSAHVFVSMEQHKKYNKYKKWRFPHIFIYNEALLQRG